MKLYWFWSFSPQKVRLALNELDLEHEIVPVDLFKRQQRSEEFLRLNPFGKVPVLVEGDLTLNESNAILYYLGEREQRLWPSTAAAKADAVRWMFFEARHINYHVGWLWFSDFVAPQAGVAGDDERRAIAEVDLESPLKRLDKHLRENQWALGAEFSLVDCCFGPTLDALSLSDFDLSSYRGVLRYLNRIRVRRAWSACEFRERVA